LRIAIDARPLIHPGTGISRYTAEIITRLASSRQHELILYAHQTIAWVDNRHLQLRCGHQTGNQLASLFAQLQYPRWGRLDEIDVFWSPRHHLPIFTSVPTVVTIHDLVWRKAPESMIPLGRTLERLLMPPSLRKAYAVIAVSEATKHDLIEYLPSPAPKTTVIPEAPFQPLEPPPVESRRSNDILFVGTFEPRKNIPGIVKAFARLIAQGITSHRLILAGNPGWKENIPGLIDELGLSTRVEILGPVDQPALEQLYVNCDFVVQPAFYEGFGLPILEAMTFGKPVITSNLSAMPEVAGDAALLVDPYSVDSITEAMKRLITEPDLYQTLASRTRAQAAKFNWDRAAADTLKVFESVVDNAS
jgi:glycosyltransferase involved in cell wall biosynthesis